MYQLKGFIEINTLASNVTNVVAPIGELSTYCSTFSKDKSIFNKVLNRAISLICFSSKSSAGNISAPDIIVDKALEISDWIYARQSSLLGNSDKVALYTALITQFSDTCTDIALGDMVSNSTGLSFPQWITWSSDEYTVEVNNNKIWFSDANFRAQYDEYEIIVVPPTPNIEYFFQSAANIRAQLASISWANTLTTIANARGYYPETVLSSDIYQWVNPGNVNDKIDTNWSVLIYGPAGNSLDLIKAAITSYIVANTSRTPLQWQAIFPGIFARTEFMILPRWHNYAVENMVLTAGIYSSVVNYSKELANMKTALPSYTAAHINNHACAVFNPYKNLALNIIGSFQNKDNLFEITQLFSDIIAVSTTSYDFNRMNVSTQGFLNLLADMLIVAEALTDNNEVPVGMRKTVRDGVTYVEASYMSVQYLVSSKLTTPAY